jgi:3-hydroxyacyl-CoA dehydrogenase / enoyl-CoA hydratase / 3-hydroxybutyryl-CoA epimerase
VAEISAELDVAKSENAVLAAALACAGFRGPALPRPAFDGAVSDHAFWFEAEPATDAKRALRRHLAGVNEAAGQWRSRLSEEERRAADYLLVKEFGFPAYLGGVFAADLL